MNMRDERAEQLLHLDQQKNAILLAAIEATATSVRMDLQAAQETNTTMLNAQRADFRDLRKKVLHAVAGIDEKVSGLDQKVSGLDQKVSGIDQKVAGLGTDLREFKTEIRSGIAEILDRLPPASPKKSPGTSTTTRSG
jgi:peptidoglycan hydrolase CwlO-like protein